MENKNDAPDWAQELINTVEELKQKVNNQFPDEEKKPDFSAFIEKLKLTGQIPDDK